MTTQTIDVSNGAVFDSSGRIVSREEQAALARAYGRYDFADEILGIKRPGWFRRLRRALGK